MKCDQCGLESGFDEAFVKQPRLLGLTSRTRCPTCVTRENQRSAVHMYVLLPITAGILYLAHPSSSWSGGLLGLALVALAFIPLTVLHEMAHAGVARGLGLKAFGITIGYGRRLPFAVWRTRRPSAS